MSQASNRPRVDRTIADSPRHRRARAAARRSAAGLTLAAAGLALTPTRALAVDWSWISPSSGNWSVAANWFPASVPAANGAVYLGNVAGVHNDTVTLTASVTAASLTITDGMSLDTNHRSLTITGDTLISGENLVPLQGGGNMVFASDLWLRSVDGTTFSTDDLTLTAGGVLRLARASAAVNGLLSIGAGSGVRGEGVLSLYGAGQTLRNDGIIQVFPGTQPVDLHLRQFGGGTYNLDGLAEDGHIYMSSYTIDTLESPSLRIDGTTLTDPFSGRLWFGSGGDVYMNLSGGWAVDAPGRLHCFGFAALNGAPAVLRGGPLTFGGQLEVSGQAAGVLHMRPAETTLTATAQGLFGQNTSTSFGVQGGGLHTTILGGTYTIEDGATLRFDGSTLVRGGTFNMVVESTDNPVVAGGTGRVIFGGGGGGHPPTEYAAPGSGGQPITVNGRLRQEGTAHVTGVTTINVQRFDMDGYGGGLGQNTTWTLNNHLTVNADELQSDGSNSMNGRINIQGDLTARLTMNLGEDGMDMWICGGDIGIWGHPALFTTRLAGAPILFNSSGTLAFNSGRAHIASRTTFLDGSLVSLSSAAGELRFGGRMFVTSGVNITGSGSIIIGGPGAAGLGSGDALFRGGVNFNSVGIRNEGVMALGDDVMPALAAGAVSVSRYTSTPSSTWKVSIGGYTAGSQHDLLIVTGAGGVSGGGSGTSGVANLAGTIDVSLQDPANGQPLFLPNVGDEFVILTALGGVSGTFINNPTTFKFAAGLGRTYHWTVLYGTHDVRLRLDGITNACVADFNNSGAVTVQDIYDFLTDWHTQVNGNPPIIATADINAVGGVNVQDVLDFLTTWHAGCP